MIPRAMMQLQSVIAIAEKYRRTTGPLSVLIVGDPTGRMRDALLKERITCTACPPLIELLRNGKGLAAQHGSPSSNQVDSSEQFDLVLALDGWSRLLDVTQASVRDEALAWLADHCTFMLTRAVRRAIAPDLNEFGPYDVHSILRRFAYVSELPEARDEGDPFPPLLMASNWFMRVGQDWIQKADLERIGNQADGQGEYSARTFILTSGAVVKVDYVSPDYFERSQVIGEAAFLAGATPAHRRALQLPEVRYLDQGRAVVTLVRDQVPGDAAPEIDPVSQVHAVVEEARRYSSLGVFHNDLRPWNLLWNSGRAHLIDYADAADEDLDVRDLPQVLALAGTCAALLTQEIRAGVHFHHDVLSISAQSGLLQRWPLPRQFGSPWLRLCGDQVPLAFHSDLNAAQVMHEVLRVCCDA